MATTSDSETSPSEPKKLKTAGNDSARDDDELLSFRSIYTEEYPHGNYGVICITSFPNENIIVTGARRSLKVWKQQQDQEDDDTDDKWSCVKELGESRWDAGEFRSRGGPICLANFHDRLLLAGDIEGGIHIWKNSRGWSEVDFLEYSGSRSTPKDDRSITQIVVLDETTFLATSLDGKIYGWTLDVGSDLDFVPVQGLPKRPHHDQAIRSIVKLSETRVATGSEDNHINIWDIQRHPILPSYQKWTSYKKIHVDEGYVVQLAVVGNKLVSVHELRDADTFSDKSLVYVWDCDTWEHEKIFDGGTKYKIDSLLTCGGFLLSSGLDGTKVWRSSTWECESVLKKAKGPAAICGDVFASGKGSLEFYTYNSTPKGA
jgi:hypothetical protein